MAFEVYSNIAYQATGPADLLLNVQVLKNRSQRILNEEFITNQELEVRELQSKENSGRILSLHIPQAMDFHVEYKAEVEICMQKQLSSDLTQVPIKALDGTMLPYLYPSRYCPSDQLYRLANNNFGHIDHAFLKVKAIVDWIYDHIEYSIGSSNQQTSAYDTVVDQIGVCRDFAHLAISFCRALSIPARYVSAYAYLLKPQDFHACFEAYLGENWVLFDPTKLAPVNGLIKIAHGKDAADTSIASLYGPVNGTSMQVSTKFSEKEFETLGNEDEMVYVPAAFSYS